MAFAACTALPFVTTDRSRVHPEVTPRYRATRVGTIDGLEVDLSPVPPTRISNLEPGLHRVSACGDGMVSEKVEVVAGEEIPVHFQLAPARLVAFEVDRDGSQELGSVRVSIHDTEGRESWSLTEKGSSALPKPGARQARLPLGDFVLSSETGSGLSASIEFSVTDLTAEREPVRSMLR